MIARWWLLAFILAGMQYCLLASQHRSYQDAAADMNNGPEDLLLEELVRKWKWAAAQRANRQRQPQLANFGFTEEEEEDDVEREEPLQLEPKIASSGDRKGHRNFAYRPHDAGFMKHGPADRQMAEPVNPLIQSVPTVPTVPIRASPINDIRTAGQKENIFEDGSMATEEPAAPPISVGKFAESPSSSPEEVDNNPGIVSGDPVANAIVSPSKSERIHDSMADIYLTALVAGCTASAVAAILALGVCFYRWQRRAKAAQEVEYPAYGITGPGPSPSGKSSLKSSPSSTTPGGGIGSWTLGKTPKSMASSGDKKLAHSAHMFHFQHQKQQVIALESSHSGCDRRGSNSGGESDEDNEEGDYTVYECPGLAPTGEMEVKNPLFLDDPTPATPAAVKRQSE